MESNLLYLKFTAVNLKFIKKNTFTEASRMMFEQISGYCGLAKLSHKINHHIPCNTSLLSPYVTDVNNLEEQRCYVNPGWDFLNHSKKYLEISSQSHH